MAFTSQDVDEIINLINQMGSLNTKSDTFKHALLTVLNRQNANGSFIPINQAYTIGDNITNGSWRMKISGVDLVFEELVNGTWAEINRLGGV